MVMPRDWVKNIFPQHLSEWLFQSSLFHGRTTTKRPVLPMFVAFHCILRVCYLLWGSQPACDMCRGGKILSPCARRRHGLRKWSSMSCPRSHTLQMAELGFELSVSESELFYYTSFNVPEDCTEKGLQHVWGFWEVPWIRKDLNWDDRNGSFFAWQIQRSKRMLRIEWCGQREVAKNDGRWQESWKQWLGLQESRPMRREAGIKGKSKVMKDFLTLGQ